MIELKCITCGRLFLRERRRFKFCSKKCSDNYPRTLKYSLKMCIDYAIQHGGKCLSAEYSNRESQLWECKDGHQWRGPFGRLFRNQSWCCACAGLDRKTETDIQNVAQLRGITCLSPSEYKNNKTLLSWKCGRGHEWKANLNNLYYSRTNGCPICKLGKSAKEEKCRHILERITGRKFPTAWPEWLINDLGNRLQLDGLCCDLRIAFEYDGEFHFKPHYKGGSSQFAIIQKNDSIKAMRCSEQGISLIRIPYTVHDLEMFISNKLLELDLICNKESTDDEETEDQP